MAEATLQWRRRWSIDSPLFLYMQHLSITMTCRLLRLFKVRIFPKATDNAKKSCPRGSQILPNTLPREGTTLKGSQRTVERFDLEQTCFGRSPPQLIYTSSTHSDWLQHLKKWGKDIHLPIMCHSDKVQVPLVRAPQKLQIICNGGIFRRSDVI